MKIYTKIVRDIETWEVSEEEYFEYEGPVELCKGSASAAEQKRADAVNTDQQAKTNQALAQQQGYMKPVDDLTSQIMANGGLTQGMESAMTAQYMNNIPAQFRGVAGNINNQLTARGISGGQMGAGGGDVARQFGALGAAQAGAQQEGFLNTQFAKQQGLQQAMAAKMGLGQLAGQNISGFNQGTMSSLGQGVTAANNKDQAGTALWGSLIGAAGGLGSAALGRLPTPKPPGGNV